MNNSDASGNKQYLGEIVLLFVTLLWGSTFVIVKVSLDDISPMLFITIRFAIASVLLFPLLIIKRPAFPRQVFLPGLFLGVILFFGFVMQTTGLKYTLATKSGFLTGTAVIMIPVLQIFIKKSKPARGSVAGIILVVLGILFMSSGGESIYTFINELGENFNIGDLFTLFCAFFFALYIVYLDIVSRKYDFLELLFLQITVCAILGLIFSILFSVTQVEKIRFVFTENLLFGLLYTSIFTTLVTTALQTKYQKLITPTKTGIIFSFEPVFAAMVAFMVLDERITHLGWIGALLIFTGLVVAEGYDSFRTRTIRSPGN